MTKEITRARILQEIQDKFKLREWEAERFLFSETVIPVYDIEQHVENWHMRYEELSITSAPVAYAFFTVPEDEKWHLRGYNIIFMAEGAYTVTGLYIWRAGAQFVYLDMLKGQTVSYAVNLPVLAVLNPGDRLSIYVDAYTSTAGLRLYIDYRKEDVR